MVTRLFLITALGLTACKGKTPKPDDAEETDTDAVDVDNGDIQFTSTQVLEFTPQDYMDEKYVTFDVLEDPDEDDDSAVFTLTGASAPAQTASYTILDNDRVELVATTPSFGATEGGSGSVGLSLDRRPQDNVVVDLAIDLADVTLSPSSLTFTPDDWFFPESVTIEALEDDNAIDETGTLTATAGSSELEVTVYIADNDPQWQIATVPEAIGIRETGSVTLSVVLTEPPFEAATVDLASDLSDLQISPNQLTFDGDWDTPKDITLTALDDVDLDSESGSLTLSGTNADDLVLPVAIQDDDVQHVVFSPSTAVVTEGGTATVDVSLGQAPGSSVQISLAAADSSVTVVPNQLTIEPATVTFQNDAGDDVVVEVTVDDDETDPTLGDTCDSPRALENTAIEDLTVFANDYDCSGASPGPDVAFAVELIAGETLQVDATSDQADIALSVWTDCSGVCLDEVNESGAPMGFGGNESLMYTATATGTHYVVVDTTDSAAAGTVFLSSFIF